jgi:hypothetical protein
MPCLGEVIGLETKRADAWLQKDKAYLAELLDEHFHEINVFGRFSKEALLGRFFEDHDLIEYDMFDHQYLNLGAWFMGVSYRVKEKLRSKGEEFSFECYVVAIYKKHGDKWSLLLWQITPLS